MTKFNYILFANYLFYRKNKIKYSFLIFMISFTLSNIPHSRIIAEWEPVIGTMVRWPLAIPSRLAFELSEEEILYVLVENFEQQNQAINYFNNNNIGLENIHFIFTQTYSHWTRDYGPQFLISDTSWHIINQEFNGYLELNGCGNECNENMLLYDCNNNSFCNDQPNYQTEGYDCYVNNEFCQDFNGDGQILDWIGDSYCDDGTWGLNFQCDEYSYDCGDCETFIEDSNGYCDDNIQYMNANYLTRIAKSQIRGWDEDDNTNIDFAINMNMNILNIPIFLAGGNFMTDGYGTGFSTEIILNENNLEEDSFKNVIREYLNMSDYHIFDNPNVSSIQHIDCIAKLVNEETMIIKKVHNSNPEYQCIENFVESVSQLNTFYNRPYKIFRIFCPEILSASWEINPVAAYTNSLILNDKVFIPQYGILEDQSAINTYENAMPGYEIIGIEENINFPWYSEDALHCRTIGIHDRNIIHISHKAVRTEEVINNNIEIEIEIRDYHSISTSPYVISVNWKYTNETEFNSSFELDQVNNNIFIGRFQNLNFNDEINYFISLENNINEIYNHPITGWHTFQTNNNYDLNNDNYINVQDILYQVNLILSNEFTLFADLNNDNQLNIIDIMLLTNEILN